MERLQDELKRLESVLAADSRRLRRAESERWGLLRKGFLACLGLVALLLWYMNNYSETRAALREVCALVAAKIKADAGGMTAEELKEVTSVCDEKAAL